MPEKMPESPPEEKTNQRDNWDNLYEFEYSDRGEKILELRKVLESIEDDQELEDALYGWERNSRLVLEIPERSTPDENKPDDQNYYTSDVVIKANIFPILGGEEPAVDYDSEYATEILVKFGPDNQLVFDYKQDDSVDTPEIKKTIDTFKKIVEKSLQSKL